METVLDVLHVVTAVFLVGPMAALPMAAMRAVRAGHGSSVVSLGQSTFVFSVASLVVVVFGFGALGTSDPKYHLSLGTPWILVSLIAYLVALAVNLLVVVPALRQTGEQLHGGSTPAQGGGGYRRIAAGSGVASVLLLVVVVLMVWKP